MENVVDMSKGEFIKRYLSHLWGERISLELKPGHWVSDIMELEKGKNIPISGILVGFFKRPVGRDSWGWKGEGGIQNSTLEIRKTKIDGNWILDRRPSRKIRPSSITFSFKLCDIAWPSNDCLEGLEKGMERFYAARFLFPDPNKLEGVTGEQKTDSLSSKREGLHGEGTNESRAASAFSSMAGYVTFSKGRNVFRYLKDNKRNPKYAPQWGMVTELLKLYKYREVCFFLGEIYGDPSTT